MSVALETLHRLEALHIGFVSIAEQMDFTTPIGKVILTTLSAFAALRSAMDVGNAMVLGPCRIGAHAVVGGGSLVMDDVAPYTIVAGSPAKVLRTIPHDGQPG